MKIILSRKGVDSAAGGIPSVILPNNKIVHFPIPGDEEETITYGEVNCGDDFGNLADLIAMLTTNIENGESKKLFTSEIKCHLDPDLNKYTYPRKNNWRGSFGQMGAAQTVLSNSNVEKGDIFIFFGWFNKTYYENNKLKYCKGEGFHMIYGYMQISEIIYTNKTQVPDWLQYHPHVNKDKINDPNNCIYVVAQTLSWNSKIKGYGVFDNFDESLVLTKDGMSRSKWKLPYIFKNTLITYHNDGSWKEDYFQSAYRGQEFVCQENSKISEWSKNIIENNAT